MISKLQYNNYETGEFSEEKERSLKEIISLVHNFPWEKQRDYFVNGLTSPSITLEDNEGNYLKLALYYNGKFIVFFHTANNKLYSHAVIHIEDFTPIINEFISNSIDLNSFKKEEYLGINSLKHFATNDFAYELSFKKNFLYIFFRSGIGFIALPFLYFFIKAAFNINKIFPIIFLSIAAIFYIALPLYYYFNYYIFSKKLHLILSKGKNEFYYGPSNDIRIFNKNEIENIKVYSSTYSRNPLAGFAICKILLISGEELIIPNILIDEEVLIKKFKPELIIRVNKLILAKK